jgi:hypothetical protein
MGIIASMIWELAQRPITARLEAEKAWLELKQRPITARLKEEKAWLEFSATHATSESVWFSCRT